MSTQTQPAAPDDDEPTAAAAAPSGHAIDPVESRAIISEFFRPGDKDYAPKDFIQAVSAEAREARDDTVAALGALGDDDTVIVPDIRPTKATALAAVAWSADDGDDATVLYDDDEDDADRTTFWLRLFVATGAAVVLVLGIVLWFVLSSHHQPARDDAVPASSAPDVVLPSSPAAAAPVPMPSAAPAPTPPPVAAAPPPPSPPAAQSNITQQQANTICGWLRDPSWTMPQIQSSTGDMLANDNPSFKGTPDIFKAIAAAMSSTCPDVANQRPF